MAKLNGWKRLGIVASFAWIIGAGLYAFNSASNRDLQYAQSLNLPCEHLLGLTPEQYEQAQSECGKNASDWIKKSYPYEWEEAAIVAFVPIPFGWAFTYFLLFLARWVKRGFVHSP